MLTVITGLLLAAAAPPSAAPSAALCDVGRAALRDLPMVNQNPKSDSYYAGLGRSREDILEVCPTLRNEVPAGYPLADADALRRAHVGAPIPGESTKSAFIYTISVTKISADGKTATVHFDCMCTGLCGSRSEGRYGRTPKGWRLLGEIRTLSVS
ncbi:hypothetical protein [Sphingomonas sp. R86521]|uniref:hypothetical protein n=1 Tax=Sphingomonas sp. R86521 TaxID=3093860 RepID=UPI0036D2BE1B